MLVNRFFIIDPSPLTSGCVINRFASVKTEVLVPNYEGLASRFRALLFAFTYLKIGIRSCFPKRYTITGNLAIVFVQKRAASSLDLFGRGCPAITVS
jgi:hypothetical protein